MTERTVQEREKRAADPALDAKVQIAAASSGLIRTMLSRDPDQSAAYYAASLLTLTQKNLGIRWQLITLFGMAVLMIILGIWQLMFPIVGLGSLLPLAVCGVAGYLGKSLSGRLVHRGLVREQEVDLKIAQAMPDPRRGFRSGHPRDDER